MGTEDLYVGMVTPDPPPELLMLDRSRRLRPCAYCGRPGFKGYPCEGCGSALEPPAFPPNRVVREGEPTCRLCGSGYSTHDDGSRAHDYDGPVPVGRGAIFLVAALTVAISILLGILAFNPEVLWP